MATVHGLARPPYGLDGLRTAAYGCEKRAVRSLVEHVGRRLEEATAELVALQQQVADAEADYMDDDLRELEEAVRLSEQVAATVMAEAHDQAEQATAQVNREVADWAMAEESRLQRLVDEVEAARRRVEDRRNYLEQMLRQSLARVDSGSPSALSDLFSGPRGADDSVA